jgi:hypothetical protein
MGKGFGPMPYPALFGVWDEISRKGLRLDNYNAAQIAHARLLISQMSNCQAVSATAERKFFLATEIVSTLDLNGFVHGDLCLLNILMIRNGGVRLLDIG